MKNTVAITRLSKHYVKIALTISKCLARKKSIQDPGNAVPFRVDIIIAEV